MPFQAAILGGRALIPHANDIEVERTDRFEIEAVPMGEDSRPGRKGGARILLVEALQEDADGAL